MIYTENNWRYPAEEFDKAFNGQTLARRWFLPVGKTELSIVNEIGVNFEDACKHGLSKDSYEAIYSTMRELCKLNPSLDSLYRKCEVDLFFSGKTGDEFDDERAKIKLTLIHGVCSRFSIEDIMFFIYKGEDFYKLDDEWTTLAERHGHKPGGWHPSPFSMYIIREKIKNKKSSF